MLEDVERYYKVVLTSWVAVPVVMSRFAEVQAAEA